MKQCFSLFSAHNYKLQEGILTAECAQAAGSSMPPENAAAALPLNYAGRNLLRGKVRMLNRKITNLMLLK